MIITPKKRTIFVLSSMAIAVLMLMLAAYKFKGWESGAVWSYGFASIYLFYAILFKDKLMIRFLIFTVVTGFTELLADNWLVNYTHTLVYPPNEPFLVASPAYMPFSWVVVLIQIGYIGYLINQKYKTLIASIAVGVLGCIIIPFYEYLAINAHWWSYQNTHFWGIVPAYIYVAEGLLMLSIPNLFDRCDTIKLKWIPVLGILQGLVMWGACIVAYFIFK